MSQPILHPATKRTIDSLVRALPQSLLLSGQAGVGLMTTATHIAGSSLAGRVSPEDAKGQPDSENGTISIEAVRGLYEQTRAKYTRRQTIIIDNAERMSRGAQNAFLKLLEEPNEHIYFILTSHQPGQLLPTIRSRVQHVAILPVTPEQTASFITSLSVDDKTKQAQLQFIASGLPAELVRLVGDDEHFAARAAVVGDARDFLQGDTYQKLLVIQKYKASRTGALQLIDSAMHLLRRTLSAQPQPALVTKLDHLLSAKERIAANQNITLQLAVFVL